MTLKLKVTQFDSNLFRFMHEVNRVSLNKNSFILVCESKSKLFINSRIEILKKSYAVIDSANSFHTITILNYAISQLCNIHVSLENQYTLCFEVSGVNIEKVEAFKLSLIAD